MLLNIFPYELFNLDVPLCEASIMPHMGAKHLEANSKKSHGIMAP